MRTDLFTLRKYTLLGELENAFAECQFSALLAGLLWSRGVVGMWKERQSILNST